MKAPVLHVKESRVKTACANKSLGKNLYAKVNESCKNHTNINDLCKNHVCINESCVKKQKTKNTSNKLHVKDM